MRAFTLSGTQHALSNGRLEIDFEIADPSGAHTRTSAQLSSDGLALSGTSVSTMPAGSKPASYKYDWTAKPYYRALSVNDMSKQNG